jgi:hypothetical protein
MTFKTRDEISEWICIELEGVCEGCNCPCSTKRKLFAKIDKLISEVVESAPMKRKPVPIPTMCESDDYERGYNKHCSEIENWKQEAKEGGR